MMVVRMSVGVSNGHTRDRTFTFFIMAGLRSATQYNAWPARDDAQTQCHRTGHRAQEG